MEKEKSQPDFNVQADKEKTVVRDEGEKKEQIEPNGGQEAETKANDLPPGSNGEYGNDLELVVAAEALTQLTMPKRDRVGSQDEHESTPSTANSEETYCETGPVEGNGDQQGLQHPFVKHVNRVSKHPLVTNAVKYYENSKRNYGAFNYAAGIVEKAAIPMVNKIELNLNNRHARELKKRERADKNALVRACRTDKKNAEAGGANSEINDTQDPEKSPAFEIQRQKKRRLSASEDVNQNINKRVTLETKKRLQFCLYLLRLANERINNKVNLLQLQITEKEKESREQASQNNAADTASEANSNDLSRNPEAETKTEIITTVKKIINVISNFRPSSLRTTPLSPVNSEPDVELSQENLQFRSTIRNIILKLPSAIQQTASNNTPANQTNDKFILFAKESLDMITCLSNVFNDQLEKAERWVTGEDAPELSLKSEEDSSSEEHLSTEKSEVSDMTVPRDDTISISDKNNSKEKSSKEKVELGDISHVVSNDTLVL